MAQDDGSPPALVGRAGLVFAYVCFVIAIGALSAAIYVLPLDRKAKLFLAAAATLMSSLFAFMAIATHLVWSQRGQTAVTKTRRKATRAPPPSDADGSQHPR